MNKILTGLQGATTSRRYAECYIEVYSLGDSEIQTVADIFWELEAEEAAAGS